MSGFDHMGFAVGDYDKSIAFYDRALAPLGIKAMSTFEYPGGKVTGYGSERPILWLNSGTALGGRVHVAFTATTRDEVDAFYQAAIGAGGKDNGPPGLRPEYHENYYGAFVLDPDGHNIEAVCHAPE